MKKYTSMINHHIGQTAAARILRVDHKYLELTLSDTGSPSEEDDITAVVIENEAGKWRVLIIVKELSGWHWGDIRSALIHHACNSAFMGPEVFQSFVSSFDKAADGEWDPVR